MNKIFLLALLFIGCGKSESHVSLTTFLSDPYEWGAEGYYVEVIDSCEYLVYKRAGHVESLSHKGNCKYCLKRGK